MRAWLHPVLLALVLFAHGTLVFANPRPNLLIITVDDMNADSVGVFGAEVPATTPNIDRLAQEGLRFEYAHVQVANCKPSRNVMWTGRYPHSSGVEGFYRVADPDYPTLVSLLRQRGYFAAIRHKQEHTTPYYPYKWDAILNTGPDGSDYPRKDASSYGSSTRDGIRLAKAAGKPFFLMVNIDDPHLPFYGQDKTGRPVEDLFVPSRVYRAEEVAIPGFLFDDPVVRGELANYYSSVRRADDAVGEVLAALDASGERERTLVLFLSDHGMPLPFAKTQLYHHSTRTPLILRWPGVTRAGSVDRRHMVSAVDLMPTLLESLGLELPQGLQGRSFFPLLAGGSQQGRDRVYKSYNENVGGQRAPMRAVETSRYLYIFNPWSHEPPPEILRPWAFWRFRMGSAALGTRSFKRMEELAKYDRRMAARADLFQYRVPEELYDVSQDPDCLVNLIFAPAHQEALDELRASLGNWMRETGDPVLAAFRRRDDPGFLAEFVAEQQQLASRRSAENRRIWKEAVMKSMLNESQKKVRDDAG